MRSAFLLALLVALVEGGVVCDVRAATSPIPKNGILTYTCNKNPHATKQTVHFENPRGFSMSLTASDGADHCAGGTLDGHPEGSYNSLSLTNLTFFNVPCNQVPCCIRITCDRSNAQDCSDWKLTSVFSNDLASAVPVYITNFTTDSLVA